MELTLDNKIEIFEEALSDYHNCQHSFMCDGVRQALWMMFPEIDNDELFRMYYHQLVPILEEYKPSDVPTHLVWWEKSDRQKRIDVYESIIKKLNDEKERIS